MTMETPMYRHGSTITKQHVRDRLMTPKPQRLRGLGLQNRSFGRQYIIGLVDWKLKSRLGCYFL